MFELDITAIKEHFNKINNDSSHFVNSNDICTPMDCVIDMVDTVPKSFWAKKDIRVLDSCCGNGNFHAYIETKTPLENLYFNEINEKRIANLHRYFDRKINFTRKDFLSFNETEHYDMVVSNPPYALFSNEKRASKNHNLARSFIHKALDITKKGGYILFIVPNNWMSYSDRNTLPERMSRYQFIHLNIHGAKKYFPKVGSSFTWFLLQKTPNRREFTIENNYVVKNTKKVFLSKGIHFIPLYYDNLVKSIIEKVVYTDHPKYRVETSSDLHRTTRGDLLSKDPTQNHLYKLIHTPTQTIWSQRPHKYQAGVKVFISLTNQYQLFIDDCGMTQSIAFIRCRNQKEAELIRRELNSPVYRFVNNITRYGNFNNIRVLQNLSLLSTVALSAEETDFITHFNECY